MKTPWDQLLLSARSAARTVFTTARELKDAFLPSSVESRKLVRYFYCPDESTVLGPLSPDHLYEMVWVHEAQPHDLPVCLEGTEQWVPFFALENELFSGRIINEAANARAATIAALARIAAKKRRGRIVQKFCIAGISTCTVFLCWLGYVAWNPAVHDFGRLPNNFSARTPASSSILEPDRTVRVASPTPDYSLRTAYTKGYYKQDGSWVNGYAHAPSGKTSPSATPESSSDSTTYVHGYTRKDGTYVSGHARRK